MFEKQRVNPWDLLEGHKNPAPLSWSWFGAIRMERKPLWYEDTHRLLKYHTHSLLKSPAYFLDPPPLPPEDLDPPQEKPVSIKFIFIVCFLISAKIEKVLVQNLTFINIKGKPGKVK